MMIEGNNTLEIHYEYNVNSGGWEPDNRYRRTFNEQNQMTSEIEEWWNDQTEMFAPSMKNEYYYDNNNLLDSTVLYFIDYNTASFIPFRSEKYNYNLDGNLTETISYRYNAQTSNWEKRSRSVYTYSGDLVAEIITSDYDQTLNDYIPSRRDTFEYDTNGNNTIEINFDYDERTMSFTPTQRIENTYNANNRLTSITIYEYIFDTYSNTWITRPIRRESTTYQNGNAAVVLQEIYSNYVRDFVPKERDIITVDESIRIEDVVSSIFVDVFFSQFFTNAPDTIFHAFYDPSTEIFNDQEFFVFYYSPFSGTVSTSLPTLSSIQLWPNPAVSVVQVQLDNSQPHELRAYDLTGRLVHQQWIQDQETINVADWPTGMYLIKVRDQQQQLWQTKLVKF